MSAPTPTQDRTQQDWERRWEALHARHAEMTQEVARLQEALAEAEEGWAEMLSVSDDNSIEAVKSHTIQALRASNRRLKAALREARN